MYMKNQETGNDNGKLNSNREDNYTSKILQET